ncbi:hypothetical protein [Streptococcus suis]|uniref:hypothetical protein n=1 Tax=Streptococcus suis TaxID=1307 RepID=UPI0037D563F6
MTVGSTAVTSVAREVDVDSEAEIDSDNEADSEAETDSDNETDSEAETLRLVEAGADSLILMEVDKLTASVCPTDEASSWDTTSVAVVLTTIRSLSTTVSVVSSSCCSTAIGSSSAKAAGATTAPATTAPDAKAAFRYW